MINQGEILLVFLFPNTFSHSPYVMELSNFDFILFVIPFANLSIGINHLTPKTKKIYPIGQSRIIIG